MAIDPHSAAIIHRHSSRTPMRGRDPGERHRAASPLELLYDLTFVIGFSQAATQLAHALAAGHLSTALWGFALSIFAICWAWVNFSWFASAYDNDDWIFRLATLVQMVGVVVLALGLPRMFASIEQGAHLDNGVMVLGYVIMRLSMVFLWLRAAREDPARRRTALHYAKTIALAQIGWVALIIIDLPLVPAAACMIALALLEMTGPYYAETRLTGTPWHPHHIAERYSLLMIITFGEIIVGTVTTLTAFVETQGWGLNAVALCGAGIGLAAGLWWIYFVIDWGHLLHQYRERSFFWGYGHLLLFAATAATGGGLDVIADVMRGKAQISPVGALLAVAVPLLIFVIALYGLYAFVVRCPTRLHVMQVVVACLVAGAAIIITAMGHSLIAGLLMLTLVPVLTILTYEVMSERDILRRP